MPGMWTRVQGVLRVVAPNAPRDLRGDSRVTVHVDVRQDGGEE